MANDRGDPRPSVPIDLAAKIASFRSRTRRRKMGEAGLIAGLGIVSSFLIVFAMDRIADSPGIARAAILAAGAFGLLVVVPIQLYRWVVGTMNASQVAKVIAHNDAITGDRVLSVVELTEDPREFGRSPELTMAAIRQVDDDLRHRDFAGALPSSKHRGLTKALAVPVLACVGAVALCPSATFSSLQRWANPFGSTARYTFAQPKDCPSTLYVAKGEPAEFAIALATNSPWRPSSAEALIGSGERLTASLADGRYVFQLPARHRDDDMEISIGDADLRVQVQALDRPEITALDLEVTLPAYLGIVKPSLLDGRSGGATVVEGSKVAAKASFTRDLSLATSNGASLTTEGATFKTEPLEVTKEQDVQFGWTDVHGLQAKEPFTLGLRPRADRAPTVRADDLRNGTVLLDTDTLSFKVVGTDDLGVRRVGIEWEGLQDELDNPTPAKGERTLLASETPDATSLNADCAFNPTALKIAAQQLTIRAWVEDALPNRPRTFGAPLTVFVLTPEQHMIWLTAQLNAWRDESVEVRDREQELNDQNKALRMLSAADLDKPANRKRLENQAVAEKANGRRLNGLVSTGRALLSQAVRNPEFGEHAVDDWAEAMRTLEEIAKNRMPSVADLLLKAARSSAAAPTAGVVRTQPAPSPGAALGSQRPNAPTVTDVESTYLEAKSGEDGPRKPTQGAPSSLRLAETVLASNAAPPPPSTGQPPPPENLTQEELDKALEEQRKLLEEFAKVAGQIKAVLQNLEGSTFVKRFKAEAREQTKVAKMLREDTQQTFGQRQDDLEKVKKAADAPAPELPEAARREQKSSESIALVQDDLSAYVTRLDGDDKQKKFKGVLDEMRAVSVALQLKDVAGDVLAKLGGDATLDAEFWSDTTDRWAEQLVDPAKPGC